MKVNRNVNYCAWEVHDFYAEQLANDQLLRNKEQDLAYVMARVDAIDKAILHLLNTRDKDFGSIEGSVLATWIRWYEQEPKAQMAEFFKMADDFERECRAAGMLPVVVDPDLPPDTIKILHPNGTVEFIKVKV